MTASGFKPVLLQGDPSQNSMSKLMQVYDICTCKKSVKHMDYLMFKILRTKKAAKLIKETLHKAWWLRYVYDKYEDMIFILNWIWCKITIVKSLATLMSISWESQVLWNCLFGFMLVSYQEICVQSLAIKLRSVGARVNSNIL